MSRTTITIERLVLRGFRPEDKHAIAHAVEQELTRIFSQHAVAQDLSRAASAATIEAGTIHLSEHATPPQLGARTAQTIASALVPSAAASAPDATPPMRA